jgi:hypothetical protein
MEAAARTGPEKRRWTPAAAAFGVLVILGAGFLVFLSGMGNTCNCGPLPRVTAKTDGDDVVISYQGVYTGREGFWTAQEWVPEEEGRLTMLHYRVTPHGKTEVAEDLKAPPPGQDQTVRFEQAATPGRDRIIVFADYSDGSMMVVYDNYL